MPVKINLHLPAENMKNSKSVFSRITKIFTGTKNWGKYWCQQMIPKYLCHQTLVSSMFKKNKHIYTKQMEDPLWALLSSCLYRNYLYFKLVNHPNLVSRQVLIPNSDPQILVTPRFLKNTFRNTNAENSSRSTLLALKVADLCVVDSL